MRLVCCLLLALLATPRPTAAQLGPRLDVLVEHEDVRDGFWGIMVADAATGEVLYARYPEKRFIPASNMKLYATAAALHHLGPDFRYETDLYHTGTVRGNTLYGDLIVKGAGDPSLGARFEELDDDVPYDPTAVFRRWALALKAQGITRIEGDLIGDDNLFDDVPLGGDWAWDDFPYYYAAEIGALTFNENTVTVQATPTQPGQPLRLALAPIATPYITLLNATTTLPSSERGDTDYTRYLGTNVIRTTSQLPVGRDHEQVMTVHNPTGYFVAALNAVLREQGIVLVGRALDIDVLETAPSYTGATLVARHVSPPLSDIVRETNKESNNLFAEMLMRAVGAYAGPGWDADRDAFRTGVDTAKPFFAAAGMDTTWLGLHDGSGLSRRNLVMPQQTIALLSFMARHPDPSVRRSFIESLPVGGWDGTLARRYEDGQPARGRVYAKTGTLSHVAALSGYVDTRSGRRLAFSIMANHYTGRTANIRRVQDTIVNLLADL